ncbi:MAG TPA: hypothetical protein VF696_01835 [Candidatus Paceibacterota bacterium]|jgi:hypothetical protein
MELFFAKLFGLYFIIIGAIIFVRRDAVMPTIARFADERALLLTIAVIEIIAGLGLILAFPGFTLPDLAGLISLIGYMLVIEGVIYLAAPAKTTRKFIGYFNKPVWYVIGGALSVFAGLYLAGKGFGYF